MRYAATMLTADVAAFTIREGRLEVLLIRRGHPPFEGLWALPGGFVEPDEPVARAARRELEEETGLRDVEVEPLHAFGDPGRDPRGRTVTVAYLALLPPDRLDIRAGDDAAAARWFPARHPPPLAFDHAKILACAIGRLRDSLCCTPIASAFLGRAFTLRAFRRVGEILVNRAIDPRAFRRKVLAMEILTPLGAARRGRGRPERRYAFRR